MDAAHRRFRPHTALIAAVLLALALTGSASGGSGNSQLSILSPGVSSGQTIGGNFTWTAQVSGTPNRVDFSIDGSVRWTATSAPYTFNGAGKTLDSTTLSNGAHTFQVTAYANRGNGQSVSAGATATVSNAPSLTGPASTSLPTISGSAVVGQTLSASTGGWSGSTPMSYGDQWELCNSSGGSCGAVAGATGSAFLVPSTAAGATIRVNVTATNAVASTSATSTQTAVVTTPTATSLTTTPPVSTTPPLISGSATVGQTLSATTGSWSGTTPMNYSYQWSLCNSSGNSCSPLSGATSATLVVPSSALALTIRVNVTASNSVGSAVAESASTAAVVSGTVTTSPTFDSETSYLDSPVPDLTNAITVSTVSGFASAVASAVAGQVINVLGNVVVPGEFTGFDRVISGGTVDVVFQPGAGFSGMGGSDNPAVWIHDSGGWRIWGGTITNPDGPGILVYGMPGPLTWTGFSVSNTGDTCVAVYPTTGSGLAATINHLTLKGIAGTADPNLAYDPHAEKGTGIHAWNIADSSKTGALVENTTIAADVFNQATGAGVEWNMGATGPGDVLYTRAKHLGFAIPGTTWLGYAQQQTAGNVVQLWGGTPPSGGALDVRYAEGNDIQGRMLQTGGAFSGANYSQSSIDYGVATGPIMQSPLLAPPAYQVGTTGIKLGSVSPLP